MFDDASVLECYRRAESIVPQQALALENSLLATTMAEKITQSLTAASPQATEQQFIRAAFLTVLFVEPSAQEQAAVQDSLAQLTELARQENRPDPINRARTDFDPCLAQSQRFCHDSIVRPTPTRSRAFP